MVDYRSSGVDAEKKEAGLKGLLEYVRRTFDLNPCKPLLPIGYFANVIDLSSTGFPIGIAFSTDGVGTKVLVAAMVQRYDTIGVDCVAMNVNDLLCVGATPVSMVDYIAVSEANTRFLEEVSKGLLRGCELAEVNLAGGEIAQVAELLSRREGSISFDLVGSAIGTVALDKMIVGQNLEPGDRLIGLQSNGLHSNGYSLVRKIVFEIGAMRPDQYVSDLQTTVADELLRPTRIYVKEVLAIMRQVPVKALFHITGDGLFNLTRTAVPVSYRIEHFPQPPAIFEVLRRIGNVPHEEMFRVFNMGIGFVIAIPDDSSYFRAIKSIVQSAGYQALEIGVVTKEEGRTISLPQYHLYGRAGKFIQQ